MNLHSLLTISSVSFTPKTSHCFINEATHNSRPLPKRVNSDAPSTEFLSTDSLGPTKPCFCGRRHFIEAATLGATALFPIQPSKATNSHSDYTDLVNKFHPPRPDWYEEFYASVMNSATQSYEAEVVGIDPNPKMEKYARSSAASAGLPLSNFEFIQAEEAIKKKYGGLMPKKPPLISKDHEHAYFDSADWALGKQGAQKPKGPLEALRPKLQPTQQHARSRRSAYAPVDDSEVDGCNNHASSEDQSAAEDVANDTVILLMTKAAISSYGFEP